MNSSRFQPPPRQIVICGRPVADALPEALADHWVGQAVVATNNTLAQQQGGLVSSIIEKLGDTCTQVIDGLQVNTPRSDVVRLASALRSRGTEALISIGGGSVVEAAKAARICLTNNIRSVEDVDRLRLTTTAASPRPYLFAIPTTLSGAEFTRSAGVTDEKTGLKEAFYHSDLAPDVVILDPAATLTTPRDLWLSTGIRAVDHAIESWCAPDAMPMGDATALQGLRLLMRALGRTDQDPENLPARLECQTGAWLAIQPARFGVSHGASHGIGHALSAVTGMAHGITSCIMLPHVLRFNASVNASRQAELTTAIGESGRDLADLVHDLVAGFGLPQRLRDAGVSADQLEEIAVLAVENPRVRVNPRAMNHDAALKLLRAAW